MLVTHGLVRLKTRCGAILRGILAPENKSEPFRPRYYIESWQEIEASGPSQRIWESWDKSTQDTRGVILRELDWLARRGILSGISVPKIPHRSAPRNPPGLDCVGAPQATKRCGYVTPNVVRNLMRGFGSRLGFLTASGWCRNDIGETPPVEIFIFGAMPWQHVPAGWILVVAKLNHVVVWIVDI